MMTPSDLETGSEVQFGICKRYPAHDFLKTVFSFQTPGTNDKGDIRPCSYNDPPSPHLILKM